MPIVAHVNIKTVYTKHPIIKAGFLYQLHKSNLFRTRKARVTLLALVLLMLPFRTIQSSPSEGSVIVVIRTADEIVMAADSLLSSTSEPSAYTCKIRQVGDSFFAVSGIGDDPDTGYDVWDIADKALNTAGSLENRVAYFESVVQPQLIKELQHIRERAPALYVKYKDTISSLDIIFCGVENGALVFYHRGFKAVGDETISLIPSSQDCAANCDSETHIPLLGHADAITRLRDNNGITGQPELWMVARNLVKAEIDSGDPKVGGDIDVLRITKSGNQWIQRKQECERINERRSSRASTRTIAIGLSVVLLALLILALRIAKRRERS